MGGAPQSPDHSPDGVGATVEEEVGRLIDAARAAATAEAGYWRARIRYSRRQARHAALFGGGALSFATGGVIALILGLLLVLAPLVGPLGAMLIVTGGALAVAGLLGALAIRSMRRLFFHDNEGSSP